METSESLRAEYKAKLEALQKRCKHKDTQWMEVVGCSGAYGRERVCLRCEKTLESQYPDYSPDTNASSNEQIYTVATN